MIRIDGYDHAYDNRSGCGTINKFNEKKLAYTNDTQTGNSGSLVVLANPNTGARIFKLKRYLIVGIHTNGNNTLNSHYRNVGTQYDETIEEIFNFGCTMTKNVIAWLRNTIHNSNENLKYKTDEYIKVYTANKHEITGSYGYGRLEIEQFSTNENGDSFIDARMSANMASCNDQDKVRNALKHGKKHGFNFQFS